MIMDDDSRNMNSSGVVGDADVSGFDAEEQGPGPLPVVTFSTIVLSLASSALVQLGEVPDPETGQFGQKLDVAKHNIDVLSMIRDKTAGNLDGDEQRLIDSVLYELRLKYVIADK